MSLRDDQLLYQSSTSKRGQKQAHLLKQHVLKHVEAHLEKEDRDKFDPSGHHRTSRRMEVYDTAYMLMDQLAEWKEESQLQRKPSKCTDSRKAKHRIESKGKEEKRSQSRERKESVGRRGSGNLSKHSRESGEEVNDSPTQRLTSAESTESSRELKSQAATRLNHRNHGSKVGPIPTQQTETGQQKTKKKKSNSSTPQWKSKKDRYLSAAEHAIAEMDLLAVYSRMVGKNIGRVTPVGSTSGPTRSTTSSRSELHKIERDTSKPVDHTRQGCATQGREHDDIHGDGSTETSRGPIRIPGSQTSSASDVSSIDDHIKNTGKADASKDEYPRRQRQSSNQLHVGAVLKTMSMLKTKAML